MLNEEVFIKMLQIRQLQKEAIYTMLPESMADHLEVIEEESKAMMKELLGDMAQKSMHTYGKAKCYQQEAKVRNEQADEKNRSDTEKKYQNNDMTEPENAVDIQEEHQGDKATAREYGTDATGNAETRKTTEAEKTIDKEKLAETRRTSRTKRKKVCNIVID